MGCEGVASLVADLRKDDLKALNILDLERNKLADVGCATLVAALKAGVLPVIDRFSGGGMRISEHASEAALDAVNDALSRGA